MKKLLFILLLINIALIPIGCDEDTLEAEQKIKEQIPYLDADDVPVYDKYGGQGKEIKDKEVVEEVALDEEVTAHFIDVGQADSTLLEGPDFTVVIDAGHWLQDDVTPYLHSVGVETIDVLLLSHPHADHWGAVPQIMDDFTVEEVWASGDTHTTQTFERGIDAIEQLEAYYNEPRAGEQYAVGSLDIDILHPVELTGDFHEGCLALKTTYGDVSFMFTGDIEIPQEIEIIDRGYNLQSQIYQLGHHGSSTSSSVEWLEAVNPEVGIYSAGEGNQYGHPHNEVVNRFNDMGIRLYGTDEDGTICVITDGKEFYIETEK